jgi:hypothetical protein
MCNRTPRKSMYSPRKKKRRVAKDNENPPMANVGTAERTHRFFYGSLRVPGVQDVLDIWTAFLIPETGSHGPMCPPNPTFRKDRFSGPTALLRGNCNAMHRRARTVDRRGTWIINTTCDESFWLGWCCIDRLSRQGFPETGPQAESPALQNPGFALLARMTDWGSTSIQF